jgi:hypothetical protein
MVRQAEEQFVAHNNRERKQRSLANQINQPEKISFPVPENFRRRKRLGGRLNYFYRASAALKNLNVGALFGTQHFECFR